MKKKKPARARTSKKKKTAAPRAKKKPVSRARAGRRGAGKKAARELKKRLSRKDLNYYREKLLKLRTSILESMNHYQKAALYHSQRDASGDLSGYGIHQADAATDAYDIDFSLGLATNNQEIIHEIDEALERVKNGTYGFSEIGGKFIGKKRLNAVPYARFTKEEQEEFERRRRAGF